MNKFTKRLLSAFLAAVLAVALSGCGSSGDAEENSSTRKRDKSSVSENNSTRNEYNDIDNRDENNSPDNESRGSYENTKRGSYFSINSDGETIVLYNGEVVRGTDLSNYAKQLGGSTDGTKMLLYDDYDLVLFDNGRTYIITDDLYNSKAKLSDSGAVVYISDDILYFYSGAGSRSVKITELEEQSYCDFAVSPDGKTVVYSEYEYEGGEKKYGSLKAWDGNSITDLGDKLAPYSVSNGGKLICGMDRNGRFTYLKDMKPDSAERLKMASVISPVSADHSKVFYYSDGNTYYFDASLIEHVKVSSKIFSILTPAGSSPYPNNPDAFFAATGDGSVYRFIRNRDTYESERIATSASNVMVSADEKTIIYKRGDKIRKISTSNPDNEITVADDVNEYYYFRSDPTLSHIYYIDEDREFRYASQNSKKISSDYVINFAVNDKGLCVFLTDDGTLYYSSGGGDKVKITGISDEVEGLEMADNIFYAKVEDALYVSVDGMSFKKVLNM